MPLIGVGGFADVILTSYTQFAMTWRRFCWLFYKRAQSLIVPGLTHSQLVYAQKVKSLVGNGSKWLELGCGHELLRSWSISADELEDIVGRPKLLVGIDVGLGDLQRHARIRDKVCGTASELPFASGTFDLVAANMVVEHLDRVSTVLTEVHRILRPGGCFLFHTTNRSHYMFRVAQWVPQQLRDRIIWFLQRRAEEDVFPTLYKMNDASSIKALATEAGLTVRELDLLESEPTTIVLGPLVLLELLITRLLLLKPFGRFRSNIIAVLQKPDTAARSAPPPLSSREVSDVALSDASHCV